MCGRTKCEVRFSDVWIGLSRTEVLGSAATLGIIGPHPTAASAPRFSAYLIQMLISSLSA